MSSERLNPSQVRSYLAKQAARLIVEAETTADASLSPAVQEALANQRLFDAMLMINAARQLPFGDPVLVAPDKPTELHSGETEAVEGEFTELGEIPVSSTAPVKATATPEEVFSSEPAPEAKKAARQFGERTKIILLDLIKPNVTNDGRAYGTMKEVARDSYQDLLASLPQTQQTARLITYAKRVSDAKVEFLAAASDPQSREAGSAVRAVVDEARAAYPTYDGLPDEEIIHLFLDSNYFPTVENAPMKLKYGERTKRIVLTSFEPNEDNTDLHYKTMQEIAKAACADLLTGIPSGELKARIKNHTGRAFQDINRFISFSRGTVSSNKIETVQERNRAILAEARANWPEAYGESSDEELLAILARELPFPNRKPELFAGINEAIGQLIVNLKQAEAAPELIAAVKPEPEHAINIPHVTIWQRPAVAASATGTEPKRPLASTPAGPEPKEVKTQLERFENNYGNKRALVFDLLVGRNDSGNGFRFATTDDATQFVYRKVIDKIRSSSIYLKQVADVKRAFCVTREWHVQTLVDYIKNPEGPNKETAETLLQQAASKLGFENGQTLSAIRLIKILRRHIKFGDIHNTDPALDKVIWGDDRETLFTSETNVPGPADKKTDGENDKDGKNGKREPVTLRFIQSPLTAAYNDSRKAVID